MAGGAGKGRKARKNREAQRKRNNPPNDSSHQASQKDSAPVEDDAPESEAITSISPTQPSLAIKFLSSSLKFLKELWSIVITFLRKWSSTSLKNIWLLFASGIVFLAIKLLYDTTLDYGLRLYICEIRLGRVVEEQHRGLVVSSIDPLFFCLARQRECEEACGKLHQLQRFCDLFVALMVIHLFGGA
jgi:hypothetical protein